MRIEKRRKTPLSTDRSTKSQKPSKTVQLRSLANLVYLTVAEAGKTTSPAERYPPWNILLIPAIVTDWLTDWLTYPHPECSVVDDVVRGETEYGEV